MGFLRGPNIVNKGLLYTLDAASPNLSQVVGLPGFILPLVIIKPL